MLSTITSFFVSRKVANYPREKVIKLRQGMLVSTLLHAYDNSEFYRDLWNSAGIKREDLTHIPIHKLPIVNKKMLMGSFEKVITKPGIKKEQIEAFIQKDPLGTKLYQGKYTAINTSGSSGYVGIFLFSPEFWENLMGTLVARLLPMKISEFLFGQVRIAFIGEASGHHAGFSLVTAAPALIKTLSVDVSWPAKKLAKLVEQFHPTVLVGYSSGLATLAELQTNKKLHIKPKVVISSGEPLSPVREQQIMKAFKIRPIDFYGATECLAMGASLYDSEILDIFDDILYLETVDDSGKPVAAGELGRVVITVFNNDIQPLIRYSMDDELILSPDSDLHPFTRATAVSGRKLERIDLLLDDGRNISVHPMDLVGLFFPGLKQYQVVQTGVKSFSLKIVAEGKREKLMKDINQLIQLLLDEKEITAKDVDIEIDFVESIPPDAKTGKTPIIIALKKQEEKKAISV